MKTSFYFVLWIVIYPILFSTGNDFLVKYSFIIAFVVIIALSWLLNRAMPATHYYETAEEASPMLEELYTGNVAAFRRRISREGIGETIGAVYFVVTTIVTAMLLFGHHMGGWFELLIFGALSYMTITRSYLYIRAKIDLRRDPSPELCRCIAQVIYGYNYEEYSEARMKVANAKELMPPRPPYYTAFKVFSLIISVIGSLFGTALLILSIYIILDKTFIEGESLAMMYFLYGTLAIYYSISDFISCIRNRG